VFKSPPENTPMTLPLRRERIPSVTFTCRYDHTFNSTTPIEKHSIIPTFPCAVADGEEHNIPLRATITIENDIVTINYSLVPLPLVPRSPRLTPRPSNSRQCIKRSHQYKMNKHIADTCLCDDKNHHNMSNKPTLTDDSYNVDFSK